MICCGLSQVKKKKTKNIQNSLKKNDNNLFFLCYINLQKKKQQLYFVFYIYV